MRELKNIWNLTKTGYVETEKRSNKQMLIFVVRMLLILFVFKFLSVGLIFLIDWLGIYEMPKNLNSLRFEKFSDLEILLFASIYAPIMEELTFRLPLKFSKWNLIVASMGMNFTLCRILGELDYVYSILTSIGIGITLFLILNTKRIDFLSAFWKKNRLLIFYSLLMVFSFLHLKNYEITTQLLLFSPIVILPRILGGLVFSYIRINSGIIIAICFHSFNNGISLILKMIVE